MRARAAKKIAGLIERVSLEPHEVLGSLCKKTGMTRALLIGDMQ